MNEAFNEAFPYEPRKKLDFQWATKKVKYRAWGRTIFTRTMKTAKTLLGEGSFGSVYKGTWKEKNGHLAVKEIKLQYISLKERLTPTQQQKLKKQEETLLQNEIKICKALDHDNIVKTFNSFRLKKTAYKCVYITMELCTGGDLFDVIAKETKAKTYLPLVCVKKIIQQIISALVYAHEQGYVHMDLKPENILLVSPYKGGNNFPDIKVADWGLATEKSKLETCSKKSKCDIFGTHGYMAPEIFERKYDEEVDLWAVGIILGSLLTNHDILFNDDTGKYPYIKKQLANAKIYVEGVLYERNIPENKKKAWVDFLTKLLKISPDDRVTAAAAADRRATTGMYHQYVAVKF